MFSLSLSSGAEASAQHRLLKSLVMAVHTARDLITMTNKSTLKPTAGETLDGTSSATKRFTDAVEAEEELGMDFKRGFGFWTIIGLGVITLLASLKHTVVTTTAPYILQELDMKENFIWITNAFFICRCVLFSRKTKQTPMKG